MSDPTALLWASLYPLAAEVTKNTSDKTTTNPMMQILMWTFILLFGMYFLMIRPQQKRERQRTAMLSGLSKGDQVVTKGGVKGIVTLVRDKEVVVKVDANVKLTILKTFVAGVESANGEAKS